MAKRSGWRSPGGKEEMGLVRGKRQVSSRRVESSRDPSGEQSSVAVDPPLIVNLLY